MNFSFEQGPIRPPSEAKSLLIRATRNCPWNKCAFCHTYRDTKFSLRSVEEIKKDIETAAGIADEIKSLSWRCGEGGRISEAIVGMIYDNPAYNDSYRSVAAWLYFGGETVFLQDANSIIMKTEDLVKVISFIKEKFPDVKRITSYCRSQTASRKSVEEFVRLRDAGLTRIHIGMESGCDPVLQFIRKGVTAAQHVDAGQKIMASGISLCEYVMPGLGGSRWSRQHALETADVLNRINPDHIRLRSLHVRKGTGLHEMMEKGEFVPLGDEDVVREIRLLVENLDGVESEIVSDHILNLLEEVAGKLPQDKDRILGVIDRYLGLPEEERLIFRIGRRQGLYRGLDDLADQRSYSELKAIVEFYKSKEPGRLDADIARIMHRVI
ncbi:MAG: radical SAM protein [Syntrophales bacterium]